MVDSNELKIKEKEKVPATEQPKRELRFVPAVDIFETEKEITVLADMPGVKTDDLNIDLRENILTLEGHVTPFEAAEEEDVLVEFEVGTYWRQFTISEVIDQAKIEANLKDGVLRLNLPKIEKAKPRKITVKAA